MWLAAHSKQTVMPAVVFICNTLCLRFHFDESSLSVWLCFCCATTKIETNSTHKKKHTEKHSQQVARRFVCKCICNHVIASDTETCRKSGCNHVGNGISPPRIFSANASIRWPVRMDVITGSTRASYKCASPRRSRHQSMKLNRHRSSNSSQNEFDHRRSSTIHCLSVSGCWQRSKRTIEQVSISPVQTQLFAWETARFM